MKIIVAIYVLGLILFAVYSCKRKYACEDCTEKKPPVANAGKDTTIVLPENSVLLNGSASYHPDGNRMIFRWSKYTGPSSYTIVDAASAKTNIKNLSEGTYQFILTIRDTLGLSASDTVSIRVAPDPAPLNQLIYDSLIWSYWHDPNDPQHLFDLISLEIYYFPVNLSIIPDYRLRVLVKKEANSDWIEANKPGNNGDCVPPFSYYYYPNALFIDSCPLDFSLVGKKGAVKIIY